MPSSRFHTIGVVGAGLIGGSLVGLLNAHVADAAVHVLDAQPAHYATLRASGMTFEAANTLEDLAGCDLVLVCVPPALAGPVVVDLLAFGTGMLVVDMTSVKHPVQTYVQTHSAHAARFIGGHPLAGGNQQGPAQASASVLAQSQFVICPHADNAAQDIAALTALLAQLSFVTMEMDAVQHDDLLARTSHLPHLISYAFARSLAADKTAPAHDPALQDAVFSRSTREMSEFASENIPMWADIFTSNNVALSRALDGYILTLLELRSTFGRDSDAEIKEQLTQASAMSKQIRRTTQND